MSRAQMRIAWSAFLCGAAFGQSAESGPKFDIADVHVSPRANWVKTPANSMQGGLLNAARYELRRATMLDLIRTAYAVDAEKIYGGPNWLDYDRFEIVAKAQPGTRPETLRLMLQSLLVDRFKLVVKSDTRAMPAYVLSVGKDQPKLRAAENSNASGCQVLAPTFTDVPRGNLQCREVTMEVFAGWLRRLAGARLGNLPVVNSTGLDGAWDIDFQYPVVEDPNGRGIIEAVEKQLGLKLEMGKAPQPALVVESVNEQPSPNSPGVAEALPPVPLPEFEVASIRPCDPNSGGNRAPRFESGGRVTANCWPLGVAIRNAWGLGAFEELAGAPKWLQSGNGPNISIAAKAPAGAFVDAQGTQDRDALNAMMRALLMDRFKMAVHYEERPMNAYTLVAVKPKLAKADLANRTGCTRQGAPFPGTVIVIRADAPPAPLRLVCQNITMAQFAEQIPGFYPDAHYPVVDGTGLEGAWDFTVSYNIILELPPALAGRGGAPAAGEPSDPSGAISFAAALEKQVGLKLEMHKRPARVLVIDHIEEKPSEN